MTQNEINELPIMDALSVLKLQKMEQDRPKKIKLSEWKKKVEVTYICGPSGAGKTTMTIAELEKANVEYFDEVKKVGDFWHGTTGEGIAVYDDFRDSHVKASEFINFIDYNTHKLNIKGGSVVNKYEKIFITSVQSPFEIYKNMNNEPRKQWLRRMNLIMLDEDGNIIYSGKAIDYEYENVLED